MGDSCDFGGGEERRPRRQVEGCADALDLSRRPVREPRRQVEKWEACTDPECEYERCRKARASSHPEEMEELHQVKECQFPESACVCGIRLENPHSPGVTIGGLPVMCADPECEDCEDVEEIARVASEPLEPFSDQVETDENLALQIRVAAHELEDRINEALRAGLSVTSPVFQDHFEGVIERVEFVRCEIRRSY